MAYKLVLYSDSEIFTVILTLIYITIAFVFKLNFS